MKNNKIKLIFALLGVVFCLSVAQGQAFKKGYIIQHNGDSIFGEIELRSDGSNADECVFRTNQKAAAETYYPQQLVGYRFSDIGRFYVTKEIELDGVKHLVFLEYLLEGRVNLFYYKGQGEHYFFETQEGRMLEIEKKDEILQATVEEHQGLFMKSDNRYIGVLSYLFRDCPDIVKEIPSVDVSRKDLVKITKRYHDMTCEDGHSCIIFESAKRKIKATFYLNFGAEYIDKSFFDYIDDNTNTFVPRIEGGVLLSLPQIGPNWRINSSIGIQKLDFKSEEYNLFTPTPWSQFLVETMQYDAKLGALYYFSTKSVKPSLGLGASIIYTGQTKGVQSVETLYESFDLPMKTRYSSVLSGIYGQIGLEIPIFKKISLMTTVGCIVSREGQIASASVGLCY